MTPDQSRGIPGDAALVEPYPDELICTTCEGREAVMWWAGERGDYIQSHTERVVMAGLARARTWRERGFDQRAGVDACPECGRGGEVGKL